MWHIAFKLLSKIICSKLHEVLTVIIIFCRISRMVIVWRPQFRFYLGCKTNQLSIVRCKPWYSKSNIEQSQFWLAVRSLWLHYTNEYYRFVQYYNAHAITVNNNKTEAWFRFLKPLKCNWIYCMWSHVPNALIKRSWGWAYYNQIWLYRGQNDSSHLDCYYRLPQRF